jgi:hypothetical protein
MLMFLTRHGADAGAFVLMETTVPEKGNAVALMGYMGSTG